MNDKEILSDWNCSLLDYPDGKIPPEMTCWVGAISSDEESLTVAHSDDYISFGLTLLAIGLLLAAAMCLWLVFL